jgi:hypothetical protein
MNDATEQTTEQDTKPTEQTTKPTEQAKSQELTEAVNSLFAQKREAPTEQTTEQPTPETSTEQPKETEKQSYYNGKYDSIENFTKAHEALEKRYHETNQRLKELEQEQINAQAKELRQEASKQLGQDVNWDEVAQKLDDTDKELAATLASKGKWDAFKSLINPYLNSETEGEPRQQGQTPSASATGYASVEEAKQAAHQAILSRKPADWEAHLAKLKLSPTSVREQAIR